MEATPARKEPITKVMEITELILMPISWDVSKSRETARMAIPILVWLISSTSATTSTMVRMGVMMVMRLTLRLPICITLVRKGMSG